MLRTNRPTLIPRALLAMAPLMSLLLAQACGGDTTSAPDEGTNGFNDAEAHAADGKFDTGWVSSLDSVEVELDLEGDTGAAANAYWDGKAPLKLGQFALTYLRNNAKVFVQSLAEDYANGNMSVEWEVNGEWKRANETGVSAARPTHFRLAGVSAIVIEPSLADDKLLGTSFDAVVPKNPGNLFATAGAACGTPHGGIDVDQGVYWYLWDPSRVACKDEFKQTVSLKVSKVLPRAATSYPEYDRLLADGKITVAIFYGQVEHGELSESDYAYALIKRMKATLEASGFTPDATRTDAISYVRNRNNVTAVIDVYGPDKFSGLQDYAHVDAFDAAVTSHEVVVWNGHSVLGASDFWARPELYEGEAANSYQIFLYNGCLGYEYYVNPILEGKKSWANVDLVTNTIETPFAIVHDETVSALGLIIGGAEKGGSATWQTILARMNDIAGEGGFYGASGVRTNTFTPANP